MDQQNTGRQSSNKAVVAVIIIVLLAGIGGGAYYLMANKNEVEETASTVETSQTTSPSTTAETKTTTGSYKDGTYQATGSYSSPGGQESIEVSVTIADGTITAATVKPGADNSTSKEYQGYFISGYKKLVIGKSIDDVELDRVAGSSLTPAGFNDAIDQIKNDATA